MNRLTGQLAPPTPASSAAGSAPHAAQWRSFVAASPFGDVLQCLEWGDVKQPEWRAQGFSAGSPQNGQEALSSTALMLSRSLGAGRTFAYLPRGPIVDWNLPDGPGEAMAPVLAAARKARAAFIKIDPAVPDNVPGVHEQLASLGFRPSPDAASHFGGTQPRCNMKLDLSGSLDDVQARFHAKWRYNMRLAAKKGVLVNGACTRDDLATFHALYHVTAGRNGFTGRPLSYFQKMWDALVPAGLMKLFLVTHEGQPLSGAINFLLAPQCWYVYGASSNEGRNLMPNHLMQWTMIQWAHAAGCRTYDFRGVPDPSRSNLPPEEEGLVRFKTGFGAELVRYVGEYDLVLDPTAYWVWTRARPRLVSALKRLRASTAPSSASPSSTAPSSSSPPSTVAPSPIAHSPAA